MFRTPQRGFSPLPLAACALAILFSALKAPDAQAHRRDFPFTYDWFQAGKGEKELESQTLYRWSDHSWEEQLELEYGVSERFMVAPYVVYSREDGDHLRYSAFKVETRYQLGNYKVGRVLPGLYLEYEKPKGEKGEIEAKIILSRYDKDGGDWSLNGILEQSLERGEKMLSTYSFGYARPLGKSPQALRGGFEFIRDIDDGRLNFGPVIGIAPQIGGKARLSFLFGYGFPVNRRENNKGELRLLTEYEWF